MIENEQRLDFLTSKEVSVKDADSTSMFSLGIYVNLILDLHPSALVGAENELPTMVKVDGQNGVQATIVEAKEVTDLQRLAMRGVDSTNAIQTTVSSFITLRPNRVVNQYRGKKWEKRLG